MKIAIATVGLLGLLLEPLQAQAVIGQGARIDRGTRIRITDVTTSTRREGVLVEWRGDSALARIDASGEYVVVPPGLVGQVEVYDGKRSRAGKGAGIGAGVGLGLGLLVALAASADEYSAPTTKEVVAFVGLSTATYAGIGALIGSFVRVPHWRTVNGTTRVQAIADPRGRLGLAFTVGF